MPLTMTTSPFSLPPWKELYRSAILESDLSKVTQRFDDAMNAVLDRIEALDDTCDELADLNHALNCLRTRRKKIEMSEHSLDEPKAA